MPCALRSRWCLTARIGGTGRLVVDTYGRVTGLAPPHASTRRASFTIAFVVGKRQVGDLATVLVPAPRLPQVHVYDYRAISTYSAAIHDLACVYGLFASAVPSSPLTSNFDQREARKCLRSAKAR